MHVINTLMFSNEEPWAKKDRNKDLPIDCYNGAEICELIGTYLFDQINAISKKKKKKMRLFRDARLGIFKKMSRLEVEREKISDNEI